MAPSNRFRLESAVFFAAALGFCAAATEQGWFRVFDLAVYDSVINRDRAPLMEDLIIVGIDEQSLSSHGAWPWPRSTQARLLARIGEGRPAAVFADIVYAGRTEPAADDLLASAAAAIPVLALPVLVDALATGRQLVEVLPYPDLLEAADVLGHAHVELESDAIARGVYLNQGIGSAHWPHVAYALAKALGYAAERTADCTADPGFSLQNQLCDFVYLPFAGPPGTIPEVSAADLLDGRVDAGVLAGRIVFVGITTSAAPDSVTSPVSGHGRPMAGVEFNGNLFNAVVQNRLIEPASGSLILLISLACVVLPVLLLPRLSPKAMLIAALFFACVPAVITIGMLALIRIELPLAAAIVTCLLCYPYWSWRRHEIAWSFVANELARLTLERSRWVHYGQNTAEEAGRALGTLLGAEPVWYEAAPAIGNERQIVLPGAAKDGCLVLTRQKPFSKADRHFAEGLEEVLNPPRGDISLPGERLAAQIRMLQTTAKEVRLGREVGLRGLEEMPIGVAVISPLNQALLVNNAWRTLLNTPRTADPQDLNQIVSGIVPPLGSSWLDISRSVLLDRKSLSFETQTESGTPVVIEAAPLIQTDDSAQPWVITLTDVSDVRIAERHREEALAFLSHDLRSPMQSVLALVRSAPSDSLLDDIGRYAQKALSVSDQFLALSRAQAREQFETYEVDLVAVLDNAIDHVFHLAREKGIVIESRHELGEEEAAWTTGNGEMLERAFINLLSNAIKYSGDGLGIRTSIRRDGQHYVIDVIDEGVGIPEDELERIFDPYFRSNEPRLAAQRGTGLGLRFVKTVAERHGGSVAVSSSLNEGSRFTVTLPVTQLLNE